MERDLEGLEKGDNPLRGSSLYETQKSKKKEGRGNRAVPLGEQKQNLSRAKERTSGALKKEKEKRKEGPGRKAGKSREK